MSLPSIHKIAQWTINTIDDNWCLLSRVCSIVLQKKLAKYSSDEIEDLVESNLTNIAE